VASALRALAIHRPAARDCLSAEAEVGSSTSNRDSRGVVRAARDLQAGSPRRCDLQLHFRVSTVIVIPIASNTVVVAWGT
jgi:hypothetical protein